MLKLVKNVKNNGIYNTFHGSLSQEWMGDTDPPLCYVMLTKFMSIYITLIQVCIEIEIISQHPIK